MSRRAVTILLTCFCACKGDPVLYARRVMSSEPAKAVEALSEAVSERPDCFDCWLFLGLAKEKVGDIGGAIEAYEKAVGLEEALSRPEPVLERLLWLYRRSFDATKDEAVREDLARRAAPLEVKLGVARPWANEFLYEKAMKEFRSHAAAGKRAEALEAANAIQAFYLPREKKVLAAREVTDFLRRQFARDGAEKLRATKVQTLKENGFVSNSNEEIVLRNDFRVPSKREDPAFDAASDDFPRLVRARACLPLRQKLRELVDLVREDLRLRQPTEEDLDRLFTKMFTYAQAGYLHYGAEANPVGQTFMCKISLPLEEFVAEVYQFSE